MLSYKLEKTCVFVVVIVVPIIFISLSAEAKVESEVGFAISYYQYQEPSLMSLKATNLGFSYIGKLIFQDSWFVCADLAATVSYNANYTSYGTGSSNNNEENWYTDIRSLFGRNFEFENFALSPYAGFGYRYLDNDSSGMVTSTGHIGYRRESNYYYLPIGIAHQIDLSSQSKLITNFEFDSLIVGKQISHLSNRYTNTQKNGYGFRVSAMYQIDNLLIGPYLTYWCINISDIYYVDTSKGIGLYEPKNNTIEAGLKFSYRF